MNQKPLQKYINEVPSEIRFLLKGISNEENLGIIVFLLKEGKGTFNEMKKKFKMNPSSLTRNLKALQKGNLIKNYYEKNNKRVYSYYEVTDIPELLLSSLFDISKNIEAIAYSEQRSYADSVTDNLNYSAEREVSDNLDDIVNTFVDKIIDSRNKQKQIKKKIKV